MSARKRKRVFLLVLCALGVVLFTGLGLWQIERRAWKLDLIARVESRVHAPAVPPPPRSSWARLDPWEVEYRHVRATGVFLHDKETLVDALTELGPGRWLMTPLRTSDGLIIVNRGFVPDGQTAAVDRPSGEVTASGLLRLSEPGGRFLRPNVPADDRWYSRDVAAIARTRNLPAVAPFFIDADASAGAGRVPVGGLTVIKFRNAHLVYALTWFGLAGLCLAGLVLLLKPANR